MCNKIIEACQFLLNNYPEAQETREYIDSRLNKESQQLFQFGYFPDAKNILALIDIVGEQELRNAKLFYTRDIEDSLYSRKIPCCHFEHHPLIMPFKNTYGKNVGMVGRTLLNEKNRPDKISKYKYSQETVEFKKGNLLFGLYENKQSILDAGNVFVVEGQLDVIKAREAGIKNIIGLGTNSMTNTQFHTIMRYTSNIFLLLDNDEGGQKGRQIITKKCEPFANIRNFYLPQNYKDIDDYITKENISRYEDMSFSV